MLVGNAIRTREECATGITPLASDRQHCIHFSIEVTILMGAFSTLKSELKTICLVQSEIASFNTIKIAPAISFTRATN